MVSLHENALIEYSVRFKSAVHYIFQTFMNFNNYFTSRSSIIFKDIRLNIELYHHTFYQKLSQNISKTGPAEKLYRDSQLIFFEWFLNFQQKRVAYLP